MTKMYRKERLNKRKYESNTKFTDKEGKYK